MHTPFSVPDLLIRTEESQPAHVKLGWMIIVLVACAVILALMMARTGLSLDLTSKGAMACMLTLLTCTAVRYWLRFHTNGPYRCIRDFAEYLGLFVTIAVLCATASYPIAAASQGYSDAALAQIDVALRFNWLDWYELVVAYPVLQTAGRIAYANIYFSPLILIAAFAVSGNRYRAQYFLVSFWLAAIMTLLLFLAMPAVGPLSFLWDKPIPYMPTSGTFQADMLPALRGRVFGAIDLGYLQGLVCAPSFHSTSAIIYIAAAWNDRILRWPLLSLNLAMLLSTPVEGTHYLIDILGGIGVAVAALGLAHLARTNFTQGSGNAAQLSVGT